MNYYDCTWYDYSKVPALQNSTFLVAYLHCPVVARSAFTRGTTRDNGRPSATGHPPPRTIGRGAHHETARRWRRDGRRARSQSMAWHSGKVDAKRYGTAQRGGMRGDMREAGRHCTHAGNPPRVQSGSRSERTWESVGCELLRESRHCTAIGIVSARTMVLHCAVATNRSGQCLGRGAGGLESWSGCLGRHHRSRVKISDQRCLVRRQTLS